MIAALYVQPKGVYFGLDSVDPWDESRDARQYTGPHPVVAHPPCKRWGRYWGGGPSVKVPRLKGDDAGCFAHALWSVRSFGGVLEHPEASWAWAWAWFGLEKPPKSGLWVPADSFGGYTCCVEQGHYGHRARKATWLYAVGTELPEFTWGPSEGERLDGGFHSTAERHLARAAGIAPRKRLSADENLRTPGAFRDILLDMARSAPERRDPGVTLNVFKVGEHEPIADAIARVQAETEPGEA